MMTTTPEVVMIHGRGVKAGFDREFDTWKNALETNLGDEPAFLTAKLRLAYYSDDLYPELGLRPQAITEGEIDERLVKAEVLAELMTRYRRYEAFTVQAKAGAIAGGALRIQGAQPLPPVQLAPSELYDPFVLDVIKYFSLGYREPITNRLKSTLAEAGDAPILLLSHSLGTVVAYDVLTTNDIHVDTWITLGCPLGFVQDIQAKLPAWMNDLPPETWAAFGQAATKVQATVTEAKAGIETFIGGLRRRLHLEALFTPEKLHQLSPKQFPAGTVDRWYNVYDPLDPVTNPPAVGDPTIADEFLDNGRERVYDVPVRNPRRPETHSEVGYLEALQTAWIVRDFLLRHTHD
jgi:hypothetical protein